MRKIVFRGLIASAVAATLTACGGTSPGVAIEWGNRVAAPTPSQGPVAIATPSPPSTGRGEVGLDVSGLWTGLNRNTAEVARGEYAIIAELERQLELQITRMVPKS